MENARIIVIEDDPVWRDLIKSDLEEAGHTVVAVAGSVDTATLLVETIYQQVQGIMDIAVVDGNLSHDSHDSADGEEISALIHDRLGGVTVIGASMDGVVPGTDLDVFKDDTEALLSAIRDI